jgi:hypothetical protein
MVTVFVWLFRGKDVAWGHASALVDQTYLSWWPEGYGRTASKLTHRVYSVSPIRNRRYDDDIAAEGKSPEHQVVLNGLDEHQIKNWWQSFGLARDEVMYQGPLLPWATLNQNCSTVVAHALSIGGGDRFASWSKSRNLVWTPNDVFMYALSIQRGLATAKSR